MKNRSASVLLAIAVVCLGLLASGGGFLDSALPGGLSIGSVLSAIGLVSAAAVPLCFSSPGSAFRASARATFAAAVAWLPVCIVLSSEIAHNFAAWWVGYTGLVILAVLCMLAWALVSRRASSKGSAGAA